MSRRDRGGFGSVRGAAGGIAAYVLTMKGLKVLCLEAGRMLEPSRDFFTQKFPYEWPYLPRKQHVCPPHDLAF
jgi:choline dehydrogenase-like flavoprotein